jgi:Tfp pilus assembly protein PilN
MSARKVSGINLLPKDSFEESHLGRFLRWSLITGRAIVVLTEFVVILAFGSRFWFDKKLNDLGEVVGQKQMVVKSFAEIELQMRDVLARETPVVNFLEKNLGIESVFSDLVKSTPADVIFETMSLSASGINLKGKAQSESGFAGLLANLNKLERVESISVGETKFSQREGMVEFQITVKFKGTGSQKK